MSSLLSRGRTIRWRVATATFFASAVVLVLCGVGVDVAARRSARDALDAQLASEAEALALLTHVEGGKIDLEFENDTMRAFSVPRGGAYFQVTSPSRTMAKSDSLESRSLSKPSTGAIAPLEDPKERRLTYSSAPGPFEREVRVATLTLMRPLLKEGEEEPRQDSPSALAVVEVARTMSEATRAGGIVRRALLWALPFAILLSTAAAYVVARRATAPILRLGEEARAIGPGSGGRRLDAERTEGELRTLADALNDAFDRLAAAAERERRFSADVAHELRTPLATVRAQLESALFGPAVPVGVGEALKAALRANDRLIGIVDALLLLARSERPGLASEIFDLRGLLVEAVESVEGVADRSGIRIQHACPENEVAVRGERVLLLRLMTNLLENALRHGGPPGPVEAHLTSDGNSAVLEVLDRGPGIPPALLPRLFERFSRGDESRSRETGGAGLGLALARSIAAAHAGTLSAGAREGGGARLLFTIPLARAGDPSHAVGTRHSFESRDTNREL